MAGFIRRRLFVPNLMLCFLIVILLIAILLTLISVLEVKKLQSDHYMSIRGAMPQAPESVLNPKHYWITGHWITNGHLKHVTTVLEKLGYTDGGKSSDWQIMWAWEYPFITHGNEIRNAKSWQRVNHFPGTGHITNKHSLATSPIKNIPIAFKLPEHKINFTKKVKEEPNTLWVQKSNTHRGIRIKKVDEINFDQSGTFVQKFIDNPLLIDGKKFDIGIYTVLTNIDPLRVYVFDREALFRYCIRPYHPFSVDDVDRYVVGDNYTPTWKMPSLQNYYSKIGLNHKDSFNIYMREKKLNVDKVWEEIYATIRDVFETKEERLITAGHRYKSQDQFFEMVRFDFVIDADLNVFLMEVNMSPNLSTGHFSQNRILYEQVLMNLFSLVGVARTSVKNFATSDLAGKEMLVADHDIVTFERFCLEICLESCSNKGCKLCIHCMSDEDKTVFKKAFLEHSSRMNMRRVVPKPVIALRVVQTDGDDVPDTSSKNKIMSEWFRGKCLKDSSWCQ